MESSRKQSNEPSGRNGPITVPSPALSQSSTVFESTPRVPIRHRATFARLASVDDGKYEAVKDEDDITEPTPYNDNNDNRGLGISFAENEIKKHMPSSSDDTKDNYKVGAYEMPPWSTQQNPNISVSSFQSSLRQGTAYSPDIQGFQNRRSFAQSLRMVYDEFVPVDTCAADKHFHRGRKTFLSVTILVLAVYSTILSFIFLFLALRGQRYPWIKQGGVLSPSKASLLATFFAKTIELSFATVFVTFLGQVISRRAFMKNQGRGVTLAEMDMRSWVMQPGTMITHFEALKTSILSFLGVLSLVAAIAAMLYTTASEGLVQPNLRFGPWQRRLMQGLVKTSFANTAYLGVNCPTPIRVNDDSIAGTTCLQIQYAAQSYHNYQRYISEWAAISKNGNGSSDLSHRPKGFALLYENTTVTAPWIEIVDVANSSSQHNRIINNVTLAMPHAGVPAAAHNDINGILQPEDLLGLGVYNLHASVPSPAVNVLCANMNATELEPIVYMSWGNNSNSSSNATDWPTQIATGYDTFHNKTVVDDIFGWDENHSAPIFFKLPIEYNTILNTTGVYGRHAIYLLGMGTAGDYALCSIKVFQTPYCSTRYNASSSGAKLEAVCAAKNEINPNDPMQYIQSMQNATSGASNTSPDWVEMAGEWANSLSLNAGITDGQASNARLLTELMLQKPELNTGLPSMAEGLAVLAGSTLLMSSQDAPYVQYWNYSSNDLEPGQYQYLNASIRAQEYSSGGNAYAAMRGFYIVLIAVLVINLICLGYFISQNGLVTDFSEPLNLFSLAVNSPPSDVMAGSCAAGPRGKQYRVGWFVNAAGDHLFMENKVDHGEVSPSPLPSQGLGPADQISAPTTPLRQAFDKMSRRKSWF